MNFSVLASQALSAPPYLVAFFIVLLTAFFSDRSRNRSNYIIFHAVMASSGYLLIAIAGALRANPWWRYIGVYPAASGFFSAITLILAWTINNQNSDSKRGTGVAMLNLIGQFGPLLGTRLYPDSDRPYYVKGMMTCSGFMLLVAILAFVLRKILTVENEKHGVRVGFGNETRRTQEEESLVEDNAESGQAHRWNMLWNKDSQRRNSASWKQYSQRSWPIFCPHVEDLELSVGNPDVPHPPVLSISSKMLRFSQAFDMHLFAGAVDSPVQRKSNTATTFTHYRSEICFFKPSTQRTPTS